MTERVHLVDMREIVTAGAINALEKYPMLLSPILDRSPKSNWQMEPIFLPLAIGANESAFDNLTFGSSDFIIRANAPPHEEQEGFIRLMRERVMVAGKWPILF